MERIEEITKEIREVATKMAILAKMSTDDTEELMNDLKNEELTETELLEVLNEFKMFLKLGEELTKGK